MDEKIQGKRNFCEISLIFQPGTFLDSSIKDITYTDFINKELILFSLEDCARSVPSVVDGLKPGQRKVLFACFKRNLKKELKVAQLSGYVAENSAYLHGEVSLQSTIVNMAQNLWELITSICYNPMDSLVHVFKEEKMQLVLDIFIHVLLSLLDNCLMHLMIKY